MIERQVTRYFCNGCDKEYKSKSGCKAHEKLCWKLPHTKACLTCRFSSTREEGNGVIIKLDGYNCSHPGFQRHVGRYADKHKISVGCQLHSAWTIDDYPEGEGPLWLQEE